MKTIVKQTVHSGLLIILVTFLHQPIEVIAEDAAEPSISCEHVAYDGELFTKTYEQSRIVQNVMCDVLKERIATGQANNDLLRSHLQKYSMGALEELKDFGVQDPNTYAPQFSALNHRFENVDVNNPLLPDFTTIPALFAEPDVAGFSGLASPIDRFEITAADADCTAIASVTNCLAFFDEFGSAFNTYRGPYNELYDNTELLDTISKEWDKFLEVSKSQTALEVILTTQLQKSHFKKDHLVGPPPFQVIAIHPDIAYSHVSALDDGDNDGFGLSVEWIGVNFWNARVPWGVSLASLYLDEEDIKDTGHGLQFHFYNRYSIGWSKHDDEDAFYVNVDVLKFFEKRKSKYQKYLDKYF